MCFIGEQSR